jgi:predicted dehydrogenase
VSCSYGPGRYDPVYEEGGQDYPLPFVRWTGQRNFAAILDLMARGALDPTPLISHRFPFSEAGKAYDLISGAEPSLGVLLSYQDRGGAAPAPAARVVELRSPATREGQGVLGVIGAGNFAVRTLLPALRAAGFRFHTVVTSGGVSGSVAAARFGFERVATDPRAALEDPEIDAIAVLTRHDSHADLARRALEAGKHVFVEKPLALTEPELDRVADIVSRSPGSLMVGFNRRFAPLTDRCRELLKGRAGPLAVIATVNAGAVPREHWTKDPQSGGGRIVGEACHMIDLARSLVGTGIESLEVLAARNRQGDPIDDIAHLSLRFQDGSTGVIHYLSNGSRGYPKERVECFFDGKSVVIDNWRRLRTYGVAGPFFRWPSRMDKGHAAETARWIRAVRGEEPPPIPLEELLEVSRWSVRAALAARQPTGSRR